MLVKQPPDYITPAEPQFTRLRAKVMLSPREWHQHIRRGPEYQELCRRLSNVAHFSPEWWRLWENTSVSARTAFLGSKPSREFYAILSKRSDLLWYPQWMYWGYGWDGDLLGCFEIALRRRLLFLDTPIQWMHETTSLLNHWLNECGCSSDVGDLETHAVRLGLLLAPRPFDLRVGRPTEMQPPHPGRHLEWNRMLGDLWEQHAHPAVSHTLPAVLAEVVRAYLW